MTMRQGITDQVFTFDACTPPLLMRTLSSYFVSLETLNRDDAVEPNDERDPASLWPKDLRVKHRLTSRQTTTS